MEQMQMQDLKEPYGELDRKAYRAGYELFCSGQPMPTFVHPRNGAELFRDAMYSRHGWEAAMRGFSLADAAAVTGAEPEALAFDFSGYTTDDIVPAEWRDDWVGL